MGWGHGGWEHSGVLWLVMQPGRGTCSTDFCPFSIAQKGAWTQVLAGSGQDRWPLVREGKGVACCAGQGQSCLNEKEEEGGQAGARQPESP